ncbi:MAG: 16S rRNA (guanine(966)-N(2))-methyltransferase RsmD [Clostridiales bacterium]|nr:16S rRNA (guanine(966)-N(2))-methyltransferase RsmD [Clostridiales bacterium]
MPRVIAGQYKGRVLAAPEGDKTRPTTDKVKEALFSIIQTRVPDSRLLDLYSGSGQIAIEALSRGAEKTVLVERNPKACNAIRENLTKLDIGEDEASVMRMNVADALLLLAKEKASFDIIYMDPPYKDAPKAAAAAARVISQNGLLEEDGLFIVEHSRDFDIKDSVTELESFRSCSYGLTVLTFFKKGI